MLRSIQDFLWSLKSEKAKRKDMEKGFPSVDETPEQAAEKRDALLLSKKAEWSRRVAEGLILSVLGSLIVTVGWYWWGPK